MYTLTPSTKFLTIKVIAFTKYYFPQIHSRTYISENQWGTLEQNMMLLKALDPKVGREYLIYLYKYVKEV
jgi:hypothetical protein